MLLFYSSMLCSTLVTSWWLFFPSRRHLAKPYFYTPSLAPHANGSCFLALPLLLPSMIHFQFIHNVTLLEIIFA